MHTPVEAIADHEATTAHLPLYIESRDVAAALDWTPYRVINLFRRAKIDRRRGRSIVCTRDDLRQAFPEVYNELVDRLLALREARIAADHRGQALTG